MSVHTLQVNMTRGEVTPYVHARVDAELYQSAVARAQNMIVLRYGGMTRVPGTLYQGDAKSASVATRFIPFKFSATQVYAIEAGNLYFRFWTALGRIESPPGTPVEVATPYLTADLKYLRVRQSGDVIYIWCKGYQPRTLTRNSETSWTLALYQPQDGPYLPIDTKGTTFILGGTNSVTPKMTSLITPSGTVSDIAAVATAWQAFDRTSAYVTWAAVTAWIQYDLPGATTKVSNAYWIKAPAVEPHRAPATWAFQGFDGANWITLDERSKETGWAPQEVRYFEFENKVGYEAYRLDVFGTGEVAGTTMSFGELGINEDGDTMTPVNLTASSVTGINDGTGFQTSDVGRAIRLLGSDGVWRWARITQRNSTVDVLVRIYGQAMPNTGPIALWQLGAWSDITGWPATGAIYEDRLTHARTPTDPIGVWFSRNADYDNFGISDPLVADDGVSLRLTGGELNDIRWLAEGRDVLAGTAGSLRALGRNNNGEAFGPTNARQRAETTVTASETEAIQIENMLLFLDASERRLYEAAFTYETEGYVARELSTLNEHLFGVGIDQIAYQSYPHRIIWGRRTDGRLVACTYDREQKVFGVTEVDYGEGVVESIMTLPGVGKTDLWMSCKRTNASGTVRHIELLADFWRTAINDALPPVYLNDARIYDDVPTDAVSGLTHLSGQTVGIWSDGRDLGDAVVSDLGVVELPGDFEGSIIVIGRRIPWRLVGLRLDNIGNQDGTGLARNVNILAARVDVYDTGAFSAGSLNETHEVVYEDDSELDPYDPHPLRTGMFDMEVNDSWRNDGVFVIEGDKAYPVTVRGVSLEVEGEP